MECCYTGCPDMDHVEEELQELITLDAVQDEIDIVYDPPRTPPALCDAETGEKQGTGSNVCPNENLVQLVEKSSDALPVGDTDIIYGIELLGAIDDNIGTSIRFKVDNIFDNDADVYVRYEKKVGEYMNTPECHAMPDTPSGCDVAADTIEVGCIEFPDTEPFALVDLYFVSNEPTSFITQNANDEREVHKCCHPPNEYNTGNGFGVVKYTFKIQCTCPTSEDTGYAI